MFVIFLALYFLSLGVAVLVSFMLMQRINQRPAVIKQTFLSTYQPGLIQISFVLLFIYFGLNLLVEIVAWIHIHEGRYNNYVYACGILLHMPLLFSFLIIHTRQKIFAVLALAAYSGFVFLFFNHRLWQPDAVTPYRVGIYLFSSMCAISIFFLASNLIAHSKHPNIFKIRIGSIFLTYNFLALFTTVLTFKGTLNDLALPIVLYANIAMITLFYIFCSVVLLRLYKSLAAAA